MSKMNKLSLALPFAVENNLRQLGNNIRIARLRRRMRLQDLADRVGISRFLMSDVEKGKPTASIAAYVGALWVLGFSDDLLKVANPETDNEGKILAAARAPKTAAKRKKEFDNDF